MTQDCSYNELFALTVLDDSMEPEFPQDCIIVVEPSKVCSTGAYVVILVDEERWFRQLIRENDGSERLVALKDGFPDIALSADGYELDGVIVQRNIKRKSKHYNPYKPFNGEAQS